jgi:hypothetical protein
MATLLAPAASLSPSPGVLDAIRGEACNLAVWERAARPAFARLVREGVRDLRFAAPLGALEARLAGELAAACYPQSSECTALIADIVELAQRYAAIMDLEAVALRLALVTTNSCRKFHADYVKARLITTYVGSATQWIDARDAARVARGQEPRAIRSLGTGDVGLFKGRLWTPSPAIHRSPPIEGTGERRLILVLDPPHDG